MKFKNIVIQFFVLFFFTATSYANSPKGYKIEVNAPFQEGSVAYLATYWEEQTYIIDSISIPQNGYFVFQNTEKELETGQYLIYVKPDIQIDFLIDKKQTHIKFEFDVEDLSNSKVKGSSDTQLFWHYLKELNVINAEIRTKIDLLNATQSETKEREEAKASYLQTLEKSEKLIENNIKNNKGTWFASFLKAVSQKQEPYPVPADREQAYLNELHFKKHYFDNIDFTDTRLWNTNILVPRLNDYLENIISQHPDSIAEATSSIVSKTKENPEAFEKMLSYFVNNSTKSLAMGMENVWAKLAEDYIFDKNISWIDDATYSQLKADYSLIEQNRLGMKAPNLQLRTIDGDSINTNDLENKFIVLYFYSPTCSYCREEIPKLKKDFYDKYQDQGMTVVAINLDNDVDSWKNFITQNDIADWHNVFDPNYKSEYWLKYNVSGTPSLYLLNKDKIILAKKLNVENLDKYFERVNK